MFLESEAHLLAHCQSSGTARMKTSTIMVLVFTLFAVLYSSAFGDWTVADLQCAASHYSCTIVSSEQLKDPAVHQEICYNCYGESCGRSNGCTRPWCFSNGFSSEYGMWGCLYFASRGPSPKFKWNTYARDCASAHIACKFGRTSFLGLRFCKLCVSRCKADYCGENWCKPNTKFCADTESNDDERNDA